MKKSRAEKSLEALLKKADDRVFAAAAEVRIKELQAEEARRTLGLCENHLLEVRVALETAREIQKGTQTETAEAR